LNPDEKEAISRLLDERDAEIARLRALVDSETDRLHKACDDRDAVIARLREMVAVRDAEHARDCADAIAERDIIERLQLELAEAREAIRWADESGPGSYKEWRDKPAVQAALNVEEE
jgi:hypothetical protein